MSWQDLIIALLFDGVGCRAIVRWATVGDAQALIANPDVDLAKLLQATPIAETAT